MAKRIAKEPAHRLLLATGCCPEICDLIWQAFDFADRHETIHFREWIGHRWYIDVVDQKMLDKARSARGSSVASNSDAAIKATRFILLVDVQDDRVLWCSEGGRCVVRGRRWKRFIQETESLRDHLHEFDQLS